MNCKSCKNYKTYYDCSQCESFDEYVKLEKVNEIERAIKFIKEDVRHDVNEHEHYYIDLAIQALEKQINGGWVSVKEKLPKPDINYLVTTENKKIFVSKFYGYGEECQGFREYTDGVWEIEEYVETVIAWQPLPEPYKEVE